MSQLVITIIIILAALGFAIYRLVRSLRNPLRGCDGCDQDCGVCSVEDLKKVAAERKGMNHGKAS